MERREEYPNSEVPKIALSDQRTRAIAIALASANDRLPNGRLSVEQYTSVVDQVRFTDPLFEGLGDRHISLQNSSTSRGTVKSGLRKFINILEAKSYENIDSALRQYADDLLTEIKVIRGEEDLKPEDLYRVFSIDRTVKKRTNPFNSKSPTNSAPASVPPQPVETTPEGFFDFDSFMDNLRNARTYPAFIGKAPAKDNISAPVERPMEEIIFEDLR